MAEEVGAATEGKVEKVEDIQAEDNAKVEAVDSPADHLDTGTEVHEGNGRVNQTEAEDGVGAEMVVEDRAEQDNPPVQMYPVHRLAQVDQFPQIAP